MKFYDKTKPLYLETDASGVGLCSTLLQTRSNTSCHKDEAPDNCILRPIAFPSKRLTRAENIQQHRKRSPRHNTLTQKFHHYCFMREVSIIRDHKQLDVIFQKDMGTLSQRLE